MRSFAPRIGKAEVAMAALVCRKRRREDKVPQSAGNANTEQPVHEANQLRQPDGNRTPAKRVAATANEAHHFAANIKERIRLEPFSEKDAIGLLLDAGYTNEKALQINALCNGFPFLLTSYAESCIQDALFYQRFFERTTRWMTENQKDWFLALCYLERVDQDTILSMIPNANAIEIMDWFRNEASVRDNSSEYFRVKPFISEMVKKHHLNYLGRKSQESWIQRGNRAIR
jgi:hypothetical protein